MAAPPLAEVVDLIKTQSASAPSLQQLLTALQQREDQIIQQLPEVDGAIDALDPALHTLGLVFILNCKAAAVPLSQPQVVGVFLRQCRGLLLGMDASQVRLLPAQFVGVCTRFAAAAIAVEAPLQAVAPLHAAALALQPTPTHFTPLHAEFLKLCLLARCYHAAAPLLAQELCHVSKKETDVSPRDLLLYHYYAGMVETGRKRYRSAVDFFTLCVSAPTHVLNTIMLEAYKKCLLCSLVDTGEPPKLPKYTSPTVSRAIKSQLGPYNELQEAFASGKPPALRACLDKHAAEYAADRNLGLAKQAADALTRRSVVHLTETYLTLSLGAIASRVGLADAAAAERLVVAMIGSGEIAAAIDQPAGMVHFLERAETYEQPSTLHTMEAALDHAVELAGKLHELHASLAADPNYLMRSAPPTDRLGGGGGGGAAAAGLGALEEDAVMGFK